MELEFVKLEFHAVKKKKTQMELDNGKHDFGDFFKMETKIGKLDF